MTQLKIKIKKGDEVIMLAGKDRGKKGKILRVLRKNSKVEVAGLNMIKKNRRPTKQGEKGEIVSLPRPVDISNVALYCSSCGKGVRVGYRLSGDKKLRICRKCQNTI